MFRQAPTHALFPGTVKSLSKTYSVIPFESVKTPEVIFGCAKLKQVALAKASATVTTLILKRGCFMAGSTG
jgi:hypothetical protein